ncbi:MAG: hypothetical protein CMJ20_06930 [Phycisphaeraceae bacterium]|nr:hypothetical protein [Phycisphaeraceae bacterium]|tara:strand:- start:2289 stop:3233 length:945 start_codon:yes stop_codon:yes gene_type:complete
MSEEATTESEITGDIVESGDEFVTEESSQEVQEDSSPQEAAESESADEFSDALSALDSILNEEGIDEVKTENKEEQQEAPQESRAQKRIRGLSTDLKSSQETNLQLQQQMQAMQQQQQEMQNKFLEALNVQRQQQQQEEYQDPADEFKNSVINDAMGKLNPELATLKKEFDALKNSMTEQQQEAQAAAQKQEYIREADTATREVFFAGEADDVPKDLQEGLSTITMMFQWLTGSNATDSAKMAKRTALQYAKTELSRQGKSLKAKRNASMATEAPSPSGRSNVEGDGSPSFEQLRSNGFRDELDWAVAGMPSLD